MARWIGYLVLNNKVPVEKAMNVGLKRASPGDHRAGAFGVHPDILHSRRYIAHC
jgi:hypothetical protein